MSNFANPFSTPDLHEEDTTQHNNIAVKIKSMDNEFMVNISAQANIEELKQKIEVVIILYQ